MSFNPFEHFDKLPLSNIDGGVPFGVPRQETKTLPDGQVIPTAIPGHPETITYWLNFGSGAYEEITPDEFFVQDLYLHAAFGKTIGEDSMSLLYQQQDLDYNYTITFESMVAAVIGLPHVLDLIITSGLTADQVWAYTQAEAPWAFV